jgi:hypothetical protein
MKRTLLALAIVFVCGTYGTPGASGQGGAVRVLSGQLLSGDRSLRSGEYYDEHTFEARAGQVLVVEMTSSAFDPYLIVISPSGDREENDDWEGSASRSRVEWRIEESGTYRIVATSYEKGETGGYEVRITGGAAAPEAVPGVMLEAGALERGDSTLRSGEFYDEFSFEGTRGELVSVDLRSSDFDTYVIVIPPEGSQEENDDHEGDASRSLVSFELPATGRYRVLVTSYKEGETGEYSLRIQQGDAAASGAVAGPAAPRVERGTLARGDETLRSGEYMDEYAFEGRPGQRVRVDVTSDDFDTYVILVPPRGDQQENDDFEGDVHHSAIEADITEPGTYRVMVTSYEGGETGEYELRLGFDGAPGPASPGQAARADRDSGPVPLAYGDTQGGELDDGDGRLSEGEYRDMYTFEGQAGDRIVLEMESDDFDTYLVLVPPEGDQIDNDDADGRVDLSRIELTLRESGRHRIVATSYGADETGGYRLTLRRNGGAPPPLDAGDGRAGRVYGVFVGISDYGGRASDLMFTADDARGMHESLVRGGGMRASDGLLLTDAQATRANIRRAIDDIAGRAGPTDTFVFFYSGHGSRIPRTGPPQPAEADDQDETLSFYDADLTDDEMVEWLANLRTRVTLLVLDSCFSGGFQKDVIIARGRMGLFSSQEDVLSAVAPKFRAGGYLAHFFAEAVGDRLADEDTDGAITALELSQYLHERYRSDVKSGGDGGEDFVRVGGPQTGYQHLVVDRGGVGPYDVLFR